MNMKKLLEFKTKDGDVFYIEVAEENSGGQFRGAGTDDSTRGIIQNTAQTLDKALKPLKEISNSIISSVKEIINSPDEIGVELGLKFSSKAGIILTSLDSEANFKISLKWKKNTVQGN